MNWLQVHTQIALVFSPFWRILKEYAFKLLNKAFYTHFLSHRSTLAYCGQEKKTYKQKQLTQT